MAETTDQGTLKGLNHPDFKIKIQIDLTDDILNFFIEKRNGLNPDIIRDIFFTSLKKSDFHCEYIITDVKELLSKYNEQGVFGERRMEAKKLVDFFETHQKTVNPLVSYIHGASPNSIAECSISVHRGKERLVLHSESEILSWFKKIRKEQAMMKEKEKEFINWLKNMDKEIMCREHSNRVTIQLSKQTYDFWLRSSNDEYWMVLGNEHYPNRYQNPKLEQVMEKAKEDWIAIYNKEKIRALL